MFRSLLTRLFVGIKSAGTAQLKFLTLRVLLAIESQLDTATINNPTARTLSDNAAARKIADQMRRHHALLHTA